MPRFAIAPLGLTTEGSTKFKLKGSKCYLKKLQCTSFVQLEFWTESPISTNLAQACACRMDMCARGDTPCATLGVAHVGGMCKADKACSVNEDTGLVLAHTIAHELGHK